MSKFEGVDGTINFTRTLLGHQTTHALSYEKNMRILIPGKQMI